MRHTQLTKIARRRGVSSVALLLSFTAILALVALGIDLGLLVQLHQQLKTAGEAAALAAAHELFDPRIADDSLDREQLARQAALNFAAANVIGELPLKLNANRANDARGDVVFGWMNPPELVGRFAPQNKQQPLVNAMLVRTRHSQTGQLGPLLSIGQMVGIPAANILTESIAGIDHRLLGFRPVACTNVPLLPLLVETRQWGRTAEDDEEEDDERAREEEGEQSPGEQDRKAEDREDGAQWVDRYTVDPRARVVVPGGDGIPEIRITFGAPRSDDKQADNKHQDESPAEDGEKKSQNHSNDSNLKKTRKGAPLPAWFIDFTGEHLGAALPHEIHWGLGAADLTDSGGEIGLGSDVACLSVAAAAERDVDLSLLETEFQSIIGQPRILALGLVRSAAAVSSGEVTNFAAGVVVESQRSGNSLTILVQPVRLNSCTAIVREGMEINPWIGKIVLIR